MAGSDNQLLRIARGLEVKVRQARRETAEQIARDWAADVRVDTGTYRGSIRVMANTPTEIVVGTDDDPDKVAANEYGTRHMAARPSARQAAEKHRGSFVERIRGALR